MQWFKDLFSESSDVSMGRFLSFICVIAACAVALKAVVSGSNLSEAAVLCGTFLGAGISGKVISKFAEKGEPNE